VDRHHPAADLTGVIGEMAGVSNVYVVSLSSEAPSEYGGMGGPRIIGVYRTMQKAKVSL